jgi:hypothetical protein
MPVAASYTMAVFWGGLGLFLLGAATRRANKIIRDHEAALVEAERILAGEDLASAAAAEAPPAPPAAEPG